jgi:hypothetical protein
MSLHWKYGKAHVTFEYATSTVAHEAYQVLVSETALGPWRVPDADDFRALGWLHMGGAMWHPPKGWPPPPEGSGTSSSL